VIGDLKTPPDYRLRRGVFVSAAETEKYDRDLSDAIGWNCIQRRNFGLLWAHDMGADVVALVDDDNTPLAHWGKDLLLGRETAVHFYRCEDPAFDPVGATNYPHLWHRGFPIQLVRRRDYSSVSSRIVVPEVQADFWNGDPDVDAICRIEHAPECTFSEDRFPMASNALAPFDSQNTFMLASLLPDYFVFPHVGRMDDIWPSYYLQAKRKPTVVFSRASVYQARNPHDLIADMRQEYIGYENNLSLVTGLPSDPESIFRYAPARTKLAFDLYRRHFG